MIVVDPMPHRRELALTHGADLALDPRAYDAGLEIKLATAIIGISSIHLLKTFINAGAYDEKTLIAQTGIHITFLISAIAIAFTDRLMSATIHASTESSE